MAYSTTLVALLPGSERTKMETIGTIKISMSQQMDAVFAGREYIYPLTVTKAKFFMIYSGARHLVDKIGQLSALYVELAKVRSYEVKETVDKSGERGGTFDTTIKSNTDSKGLALGNTKAFNDQKSIGQTSSRQGVSDNNSLNSKSRERWLIPEIHKTDQLISKDASSKALDKLVKDNFNINLEETVTPVPIPAQQVAEPKDDVNANEADIPFISRYSANENEDRSSAVGESSYVNKAVSIDKGENTSTEGSKRSGTETYKKYTTNFSDAQLMMKMISQEVPDLREKFWAKFEPLFNRLI